MTELRRCTEARRLVDECGLGGGSGSEPDARINSPASGVHRPLEDPLRLILPVWYRYAYEIVVPTSR
jgi:hypothetical protein